MTNHLHHEGKNMLAKEVTDSVEIPFPPVECRSTAPENMGPPKIVVGVDSVDHTKDTLEIIRPTPAEEETDKRNKSHKVAKLKGHTVESLM